jgi:hypothetical protein
VTSDDPGRWNNIVHIDVQKNTPPPRTELAELPASVNVFEHGNDERALQISACGQ